MRLRCPHCNHEGLPQTMTVKPMIGLKVEATVCDLCLQSLNVRPCDAEATDGHIEQGKGETAIDIFRRKPKAPPDYGDQVAAYESLVAAVSALPGARLRGDGRAAGGRSPGRVEEIMTTKVTIEAAADLEDRRHVLVEKRVENAPRVDRYLLRAGTQMETHVWKGVTLTVTEESAVIVESTPYVQIEYIEDRPSATCSSRCKSGNR